jgi:hypothetical protein
MGTLTKRFVMGSTKDYSKITHHAVFGIKQHWDKAGTPDKGDPSTTTNVGFAWSNTMNGERLANWRRLIRENKDATTDMLAESRSIDHVDGDQYVKARRKSDNRIYHRGDAGWCYPSLAFGTDPFSTLSSDSALLDLVGVPMSQKPLLLPMKMWVCRACSLSQNQFDFVRESYDNGRDSGRNIKVLFSVVVLSWVRLRDNRNAHH